MYETGKECCTLPYASLFEREGECTHLMAVKQISLSVGKGNNCLRWPFASSKYFVSTFERNAILPTFFPQELEEI